MSTNNENITPAALLEQLVYVDTFMPEIDDPSQLDERLTAELSAFADESFIFPDEEKPGKPNDGNSSTNDTNSINNNHGVKMEDHHASNTGLSSTSNHEELLKRFNEMNNSFANNQVKQQHPQQPKFNTLQQTNSLNSGISNILSPLASQHQSQQQQHISNPLDISHLNNNNNNNNGNGNDLLSNLPKVPVPPGAQSSLIAAGLSQTQIDALAALIAQHQGVEGDENHNGNSHNGDENEGNDAGDHGLGSLINPSQSLINPSRATNGSTAETPSSTNTTSSSLGGIHSRSNSLITNELGLGQGGDVDMDKRRRNTAASARFRIKKKLKEQQLERNVRELNELTITLEKKIQTLEMENKLLRNLVVEKGEQKNNDELEYLKKKAKLAIGDNSGGGGVNGGASNF